LEYVSTGSRKKDYNKKRKSGTVSSKKNTEEEDTATPEGKMMAQAISTFSPSEQARFEAFRRSTFRPDAISKFVSSCLIEASAKKYAQRNVTKAVLGASGFGVSKFSRKEAMEADPIAMLRKHKLGPSRNETNTEKEVEVPHLSELVATDASQEITIVVSTAAKFYAQKLVQSARSLATSEGYSSDLKLLPRHFMEAHRHRVNAGIDPGFFLQSANRLVPTSGMGQSNSLSNSTSSSAAALGIVDRNRLKFEAAIAAEEAYDNLALNVNNEQEKNDKAKE